MRRPAMREEKAKSLWLRRAVLGELVQDPERVIALACGNVERAKRELPRSGTYLAAWERVLAAGVEDIAEVCTGLDDWSSELRQNSPFAGVLNDEQQMAVLRGFRRWRGR